MEIFIQFINSDLSIMEKISVFSIMLPFTFALLSRRSSYIILFGLGLLLETASVMIYLKQWDLNRYHLYHIYTPIELGLLIYTLFGFIDYSFKRKILIALLFMIAAGAFDYFFGDYSELDIEVTLFGCTLIGFLCGFVFGKTEMWRFGADAMENSEAKWVMLAIVIYAAPTLIGYPFTDASAMINIIYHLIFTVGIWKAVRLSL